MINLRRQHQEFQDYSLGTVDVDVELVDLGVTRDNDHRHAGTLAFATFTETTEVTESSGWGHESVSPGPGAREDRVVNVGIRKAEDGGGDLESSDQAWH